jgi:NAD+ synthase (glutamine-hydrolysing)
MSQRTTPGRRVATLAACNLDQWAMDYAGNVARVKASVDRARAMGATYRVRTHAMTGPRARIGLARGVVRREKKTRASARSAAAAAAALAPLSPTPSLLFATPKQQQLGPELEIPGYGCEDHFLELDTVDHSWEAVAVSGDDRGPPPRRLVLGRSRRAHAPQTKHPKRTPPKTKKDLLSSGYSDGILLDLGLPVLHRGVLYNCRLFALDRRVLLVRPKLHLAEDGNYRERRYFAAWPHPRALERLPLPECVRAATARAGNGDDDSQKQQQQDAPFGHAVLRFSRDGATLASETCEELFTPRAPHIDLSLQGVEVVTNGSGSHHQLRKLDERLALIQGATKKGGGIYLYSNQRGCDGGRLYYDGCACVAADGELVAQGAQFGLAEVEVVAATVDLDAVVSRRGAAASLREQAAAVEPPTYIEVAGPFALCHGWEEDGYRERAAAEAAMAAAADGGATTTTAPPPPPNRRRFPPGVLPPVSPPIQPRVHLPEEEIAYGPAAWLWDYLRRSGAGGFLLPLSGGADSATVAAIVAAMCQMVARAVAEGDAQVIADAGRIGGYDWGAAAGAGAGAGTGTAAAATSGSGPSLDPKEFASRVLTTVYMGSGASSSAATRRRAAQLASEVGSLHLALDIDAAVSAALAVFSAATALLPLRGQLPRFRAQGGTNTENLALQNVQARLRMVFAFLLAQLVPWACARSSSSFLLVLGASNVDEALRGYLTKYDCSAADVNPIGGVSKSDIRRCLRWASDALNLPTLAEVEAAPPTAELEPIVEGQAPQTDEADMGCTYDDLTAFGRLRKVARCGPVAAYRRLVAAWGWERRFGGGGEEGGAASPAALPPLEVARRVKHFFSCYAANRHKATVLPPSYHAESYSPDDNRFDHRQFLYNARWPWQFARIDREAAEAQRAWDEAAAASGEER